MSWQKLEYSDLFPGGKIQVWSDGRAQIGRTSGGLEIVSRGELQLDGPLPEFGLPQDQQVRTA